MDQQEEKELRPVAVLGAGVIGASWTALFWAAGLEVHVYDPDPKAEQNVRAYARDAWPTLEKLGLVRPGSPGEVRFYTSAVSAVKNCRFVQENVPERLPIKLALFAEIEPHLDPEAIVASSASGLMVSEMQAGWADPSHFLVGHPFNPPHLIPLVELVANEQTDPSAVDAAEAFYQKIGKVTIRVKKEVPAHVANRLQAALWREAIHLVASGVASVEDVDKAVWAGPGLRWAAMGPHMLFNMAAGPGGMDEFCRRYADSFHHWWEDLEDVKIDAKTAALLAEGIAQEAGERSLSELAAERDALIVGMLQTRRDVTS